MLAYTTMKSIYTMLIVFLFIACGQQQQTEASSQEEQQRAYASYGEEITAEGRITVSQLITDATAEETNVKVEGVIEEVCQKKGCWMTLRNEEGVSIRVTFKAAFGALS